MVSALNVRELNNANLRRPLPPETYYRFNYINFNVLGDGKSPELQQLQLWNALI
jgi:hypothetical protein